MRVLNTFSIIVVLVTLTVGCSALCANDIYIAQNGVGANDGTSCANAYTSSFFNNAGNWGTGNSQIGPGTTVHICGTLTGSPSSSGLTAQGSGAIGNPVTILFEPGAGMTSPAWGTAINFSNRSYITVDGGAPCGAMQGGQTSQTACNGTIQNTQNGSGNAYRQASTFIVAMNCNNCEIRNIALINNYVHAQCEAASGCDAGAGTTENSAINYSGSNWLIHDNLIHDASWAVNDQANASDVALSVYNNNIYNVAHGLAIYGGNSWAGPVMIYNNRIHDYQNWDTGDADIYHADGIHAFGMNLAAIYIYDNYFTTQNQCCITAHIFLEANPGSQWTSGGNYYVFNNVLLQSSGIDYGLLQAHTGSSSSLIDNNTVVGGLNSDGWGVLSDGSMIKYNNNAVSTATILQNFNDYAGTTFANTASDLDYNAYANCSGYNCFWWTPDAATFAAWTAGCGGCDSHSSYNTSLNLNADGSPSATSATLIGKGKNLTSLCSGNLVPLCSDINGNPRPASGAWDIGAFSYGSAGVAKPAPPSGLSATVR